MYSKHKYNYKSFVSQFNKLVDKKWYDEYYRWSEENLEDYDKDNSLPELIYDTFTSIDTNLVDFYDYTDFRHVDLRKDDMEEIEDATQFYDDLNSDDIWKIFVDYITQEDSGKKLVKQLELLNKKNSGKVKKNIVASTNHADFQYTWDSMMYDYLEKEIALA